MPIHCDIEATLSGGELYMSFGCPGSVEGCRWKANLLMPPPEDEPCFYYDGNGCRSPAAQWKAMEALIKRLRERLKQEETGVE